MSDSKKSEGTEELNDEQLSNVSGGGGGVPGVPQADLLEEEGINSARDSASGLPSGKRQHKPIVITKEIDASSPLLF